MSLKEFSSDDGTVLTDPVDELQDAFAILDLALIVEDPRNVRTVFDLTKLNEMSETIRHSGVSQPILVRPLPPGRMQETFVGRRPGAALPTHELVDGARRYRASKLAGRTTIPVMIKHLTDEQVLEVQIITALQRDGLTEMDEAEGYRRLVDESQIPKESIGEKIGRSRSYVYQRLKLLDLTPESREAFVRGDLDASRALMIARIPDGKLQKKALDEAVRKAYDGTSPHHSVRDLQRWLQQNVMLRLDTARFNIQDETLHATAGPCKACPKRTGAQPDIFSDVDGADICTDPKCFNTKGSVHRDRLVAKAEAKGLTVIEGKAAKEICRQYGNTLNGYSRLDQKRTDIDESGPTLRKLLGKDAPSPVLIEDPYTKELIEAVPTAEAEAMLVAKGQVQADSTNTAKSLEGKVDFLRSEAERELETVARAAMYAGVKEAVRSVSDDTTFSLISADLVRAWLVRQIEDFDAADTIIHILSLPVVRDGNYGELEEAAIAAIRAASDANTIRTLVMFMATDEGIYYSHSSRENVTPALNAIAASTGIDLETFAEKAKAERKKKLRNDIADLKAKMTPKPVAVKVAVVKKSDPPPAAQVKRARKPSAKEVQAQIAEQLQALDQAPTGAGLEEVAAGAAEGSNQAPAGATLEEEAADAAVVASSPAQTPAVAPAPLLDGDRVTFKAGLKDAKGHTAKYSGKEGTVVSTWPDGLVQIRYGNRPNETVSVSVDELEPPPVPAPITSPRQPLATDCWPFPKSALP